MSSTKSQAEATGFFRDRALVIGVTAITFAAARAYAGHVEHGPVMCPLRGIFGIPCPGCGMTRAFCALTQGDVASALAFHAGSLPLALFLIAASSVAAAELVRGSALQFYRRYLYSAALGKAVAAGLIVYHLGRIAYWAYDGTLVRDYLHASWTYAMLAGAGG
ncbi:MAG TPA: DUF2752 domain-containing protein [Polyangiales bacterium]|nr:DUF2752 domain-containing protein [Polyangiales bacterium]